jgi:hypothetical protein
MGLRFNRRGLGEGIPDPVAEKEIFGVPILLAGGRWGWAPFANFDLALAGISAKTS